MTSTARGAPKGPATWTCPRQYCCRRLSSGARCRLALAAAWRCECLSGSNRRPGASGSSARQRPISTWCTKAVTPRERGKRRGPVTCSNGRSRARSHRHRRRRRRLRRRTLPHRRGRLHLHVLHAALRRCRLQMSTASSQCLKAQTMVTTASPRSVSPPPLGFSWCCCSWCRPCSARARCAAAACASLSPRGPLAARTTTWRWRGAVPCRRAPLAARLTRSCPRAATRA
mmetsp:Transcript_119291/g.289629  ORF Transcript_119291/g.289629 Transcript_119291/m.289629 type:complete len:229 (+) Transcript_119291:2180-2866(+)